MQENVNSMCPCVGLYGQRSAFMCVRYACVMALHASPLCAQTQVKTVIYLLLLLSGAIYSTTRIIVSIWATINEIRSPFSSTIVRPLHTTKIAAFTHQSLRCKCHVIAHNDQRDLFWFILKQCPPSLTLTLCNWKHFRLLCHFKERTRNLWSLQMNNRSNACKIEKHK